MEHTYLVFSCGRDFGCSITKDVLLDKRGRRFSGIAINEEREYSLAS